MPQFSYPKDIVWEVLEDDFDRELTEETAGEQEGEGAVVVSRYGRLFLHVERYEVLRHSLQTVADGVGIDFDALVLALDEAVAASLDSDSATPPSADP